MKDPHQPEGKNFNKCMVYLRHSQLRQSDKKLTQLANDFDQDPLAIKLLISYLDHWYDSQLIGLEQIPVLHNNHQQDRSLRRLLSAFEHKLSDSAELTLLHLLSLGTKPVPLQQMKQIFHRNPVTRLLTSGDEYQKFLAPLSKLNDKSWHKMVQDLQALNLLYHTESAQGTLLDLAPRIGHYFRQNMEVQKYYMMQPAYKDMMIASGKTTSYGMPSTFSGHQPSKPAHQPKNRYSPVTAAESSKKQLHVLRQSLKMLAEQSRELSVLRQAPVLTNSQHQSGHETLMADSSQAAA